MLKRFLMLLFVLLAVFTAHAEEAADVTAQCGVSVSGTHPDISGMLDRDYTTYYTLRARGTVEFDAGESLSGVFVQFYEESAACDILIEQDGEWTSVHQTNAYLTGWYPLPDGTTRLQLSNNGREKIRFAEVSLFGAGDRPAHAASWRTLDKCQLMLLAAHPDDDLLWFGGLMPVYAGQRQLDVQVVYLVPSTAQRRLELLDGLWHCGVTAYPAFANMRDARGSTLSAQYEVWNQTTLYARVVRLLRQYRPEVLVTHDFKGEYGHGAHRACADAAAYAVTAAADGSLHLLSAADYGAWQVKKLYVHLYHDNVIHMDWESALPAFDGKSAITVAEEALACHASQVRHGWTMDRADPYDNTMFGLYFTAVGNDVDGDDFMEHIE